MQKAARWNVALKLGLLIALLGAAYYQVLHRQNLATILGQVENPFRPEALPLMLVVLFLVPVNWGVESEKWRRLIRKTQRLTPLEAFSAVLAGVTLGLFTPNRIGEFGGRLLYLEPRNRWSAVSLSLVGSFAQILITLCVGAACIRVYSRRHLDFLGTLPEWFFPLLFLMIGIALVVYAGLSRWAVLDWTNRLPRRVRPHIRRLGELDFRDLMVAFLLSGLRYAVFTAQYLVLLRVYGIALQPKEGITAVGTIFLLQSALPSFAAVELLKRGNIALLVFGFYTAGEMGVLATSSTLWFTNLIIPAVLGYVLLLRRDFFRAKQTGNYHENSSASGSDQPDSRRT